MTHKLPDREPDGYVMHPYIQYWRNGDHYVAKIELKNGQEMIFALLTDDLVRFTEAAGEAFLSSFITLYASAPQPTGGRS